MSSPPSSGRSPLPQASPQQDSCLSLVSLSWNIEGMKRNLFSLKNIVDKTSPDLVFLSEVQLFTSDKSQCMALFKGEYNSEINSDDKHDVEISLHNSKAYGGTMVMWKKHLDKFITTIPVSSSSFLPVVLSPPGCLTSVHFALYLPTSGKEDEFLDQITQLSTVVEDVLEKYKDCVVFIRGDGNVNTNNVARTKIFSSFLANHSLKQLNLKHKTYHHFIGGGHFDSEIDIILHSNHIKFDESVSKIFCRLEHPDMDSHHDAILSTVLLPISEHQEPPQNLVTAPRITHSRQRVVWSEEGTVLYQQEVASKLSEARLNWLSPLSKTSLSVLLFKTNDILNRAACATNKIININVDKKEKSMKKPRVIKASEEVLKLALKKVENSPTIEDKRNNLEALKIARTNHRSLTRHHRNGWRKNHDEQFFDILSSKPSSAFSAVRAAKSSS